MIIHFAVDFVKQKRKLCIKYGSDFYKDDFH